MHWVDRGPEPPGLPPIRARYTPGWVDHRDGSRANPPSDARWRRFRDELQAAFGGLCGYCEELCRGETDHFQPKYRFPELVYAWSNWLFACHNCNQTKGAKWPPDGYINPCAATLPERPENFFRFDTDTGEILPALGLSSDHKDTAQKTIEDLSLNAGHHLRARLEWLILVSAVVSGDPNNPAPDEKNDLSFLTSRATQFSSITRAWLAERGYPVDN